MAYWEAGAYEENEERGETFQNLHRNENLNGVTKTKKKKNTDKSFSKNKKTGNMKKKIKSKFTFVLLKHNLFDYAWVLRLKNEDLRAWNTHYGKIEDKARKMLFGVVEKNEEKSTKEIFFNYNLTASAGNKRDEPGGNVKYAHGSLYLSQRDSFQHHNKNAAVERKKFNKRISNYNHLNHEPHQHSRQNKLHLLQRRAFLNMKQQPWSLQSNSSLKHISQSKTPNPLYFSFFTQNSAHLKRSLNHNNEQKLTNREESYHQNLKFFHIFLFKDLVADSSSTPEHSNDFYKFLVVYEKSKNNNFLNYKKAIQNPSDKIFRANSNGTLKNDSIGSNNKLSTSQYPAQKIFDKTLFHDIKNDNQTQRFDRKNKKLDNEYIHDYNHKVGSSAQKPIFTFESFNEDKKSGRVSEGRVHEENNDDVDDIYGEASGDESGDYDVGDDDNDDEIQNGYDDRWLRIEEKAKSFVENTICGEEKCFEQAFYRAHSGGMTHDNYLHTAANQHQWGNVHERCQDAQKCSQLCNHCRLYTPKSCEFAEKVKGGFTDQFGRLILIKKNFIILKNSFSHKKKEFFENYKSKIKKINGKNVEEESNIDSAFITQFDESRHASKMSTKDTDDTKTIFDSFNNKSHKPGITSGNAHNENNNYQSDIIEKIISENRKQEKHLEKAYTINNASGRAQSVLHGKLHDKNNLEKDHLKIITNSYHFRADNYIKFPTEENYGKSRVRKNDKNYRSGKYNYERHDEVAHCVEWRSKNGTVVSPTKLSEGRFF